MEKKWVEKARDLAVKLRYFESMDNIIYYDRWNACPPDAFPYENEVNGFLLELRQEKLLSPETEKLLEELPPACRIQDDLERGLAEYIRSQYREAVQIPAALQAELNQANAIGQKAWEKCFQENDFESFKPVLEKQFEIQKRIARAIDPEEKPYQVLVNRFDKDYRLEEIDQILNLVKAEVVCMLKEISAVKDDGNQSRDQWILQCDAGEEKVRRLVRKAIEFLRLDDGKSRVFEMHHPVCVCTGPRDSRPSTNYSELFHAILAVMHEAGHGFYNYNSSEKVVSLGLWGGIDGAMHESQSRFYENHVGRSREFWNCFYPVLREEVPKYREISLEEFYKAFNRVEPGLVRLQADELTNVLHIIIRYELERAYFEGNITVDDLEEAWNAKYQEYMGAAPGDSREGILQDVHWASGCVGYFQGYALGDAYAAQFRHKLEADCPDAFSCLQKGDISVINQWLRENVHQYGKIYSAREILMKATGEDLNTRYYVDYLRKKYV